MKNERPRIVGSVKLVAREKAGGKVLAIREVHNMLVDTGLAWLAGAISGDEASPDNMKYIGIGTGDTAAAADDTALETEVESRATGTQSRSTTDTTNDTYESVGTITMTGTHAITEAGLLSAAAAGTLGSRQVFAAINLVSGNTLEVTWKWDFDRP